VSAKTLYLLTVRLPHSSGQIYLPRYLMNGLRNLDKTFLTSLAPTDDLLRFWRSKVKVTACHRGGEFQDYACCFSFFICYVFATRQCRQRTFACHRGGEGIHVNIDVLKSIFYLVVLSSAHSGNICAIIRKWNIKQVSEILRNKVKQLCPIDGVGCVLCPGRFEDASDIIVSRTCPICNMIFSASEPEELFISHVEDHVVKTCPMCTQEFQPDDQNYIMHVNICIASNEQQQQQEQQHPQMPLHPCDFV